MGRVRTGVRVGVLAGGGGVANGVGSGGFGMVYSFVYCINSVPRFHWTGQGRSAIILSQSAYLRAFVA
jgi:hypothetical protein